VLNVISTDDPYFRPDNPWHGDAKQLLDGHAAALVKGNRKAVIVLLSGAPHTLYNLSPARNATQAFLGELLQG
ncbi:MAG: alpha/beta hydrolase, partial [Burkholderiales bacterium]|nr:alpha/beta hydrolase [Burkholderiales bacterium]